MLLRRQVPLVLAASVALATSGALARNHTLNPCPVPELVSTQALKSTLEALLAEKQQLETDSNEFDGRCVSTKEKTAADQQCAADQGPIMRRIEANDTKVRDFHRSLVKAFDGKLDKIKARMDETMRRMNAEIHSSGDWHRDAEEWIEMGEHAKLMARLTTVFEVTELFASAVEHSSEHDAKLGEKQIQRFKAWYERYGQSLPQSGRAPIETQIRNLRIRGDVAKLVGLLSQQGGSAVAMGDAANEGRYAEAIGHATVSVLRLAMTALEADPKLKVLISAVQMAIDDGYAYLTYHYAKENVDLLLAAQDKSLQGVNALSKLYVADVRTRKLLSGARTGLLSSACYLEKKE